MSYKTILVHVDDSRHAQTRIEMACQLALAEHAHLIGTAMTGVSRFVMQSTAFSPGDPYLAPMLQTMHEQANGALNKFEAIARKFGVRSFEKRLIDDEAGVSMCMQGRYADLLVIGQIDPDERNPVLSDDFPEYVATNCACPVLVVPYALPSEVMGTRVLIAWNASPESTRAVHNAVPLLKRAQLVEVMVFDAGGLAAVHGDQPGRDIALYLARHGVTVQVTVEPANSDIGNTLLSHAADVGADLLVMGCYGHTRFREIMLGGVSRTIFKSMTMPVLMSH
jgi:nucleotide-binding universal stress UspA family protein